MNIKKFYILFLLTLNSGQAFFAKSAVTYNFSGGRFGDCLVSYCHAFWIAYYFDLDFVYKPFKYSDQLLMDQTDILYCDSVLKQYKQIVYINHALMYGVQPDTLYIVPFFCESHIERNDPRCPFLFQVDWKDKKFISQLKTRIAPKHILNCPDVPNNKVTIALHVRKGTGWDIPQFAPTFEKLTEMHPLKWPPDSYYLAQIKKILELYPGREFFIYVFTDHDKPQEIIEKYKSYIQSTQIIWACRQEHNFHDLNVLEDFFSLMQFDCLIRSDSNFSIIASKLGSYEVLIAPWESFKAENGVIEIATIYFEKDNEAQILRN